jgi:hypothetical protein
LRITPAAAVMIVLIFNQSNKKSSCATARAVQNSKGEA